ncbi:MAG: endonuclease III [Candidatus Eiseniibacteriota bacterium]|jgi:endonuclease-3
MSQSRTASRKQAARRPRDAAAPSPETRRQAQKVVRRLARAYPDATIALEFETPLELLVATILSAQCTDVRVNQVTRALFRKYPSAEHYARATQEELERDIHSTGFFRNKAKAIRGAAQRLVDDYGGQVPDTMEDLLRLPGVARKTANVVLGSGFGKVTGVVVDTHVQRLSQRLGLSAHRDPNRVEQDLMAVLPKTQWVPIALRLILHGRAICRARGPRCDACPLADICPSAEL